MQINLARVQNQVRLKDVDAGEYFWCRDELYLKPDIAVATDTIKFPPIEGYEFAVYLKNEILILMDRMIWL